MDPKIKTHESPYLGFSGNPILFVDVAGADTNYYFNRSGELIGKAAIDNVDRFFVFHDSQQDIFNSIHFRIDPYFPANLSSLNSRVPLLPQPKIEVSQDLNFLRTEGCHNEDEIGMDSDIGIIARATYAEMRGEDENSRLVVAESIINRLNLPNGSYERYDGTVAGIVNRAYDVADPESIAYNSFVNSLTEMATNGDERLAFLNSVKVAIKAVYNNSNFGNGVIFYHSDIENFYDNLPGYQAVELNGEASGVRSAATLPPADE